MLDRLEDRPRERDHALSPRRPQPLGQLVDQPAEIDLQTRERLSELVVKVAGERGPLLLANLHQARREVAQPDAGLAQLFLVAAALGRVAMNSDETRAGALRIGHGRRDEIQPDDLAVLPAPTALRDLVSAASEFQASATHAARSPGSGTINRSSGWPSASAAVYPKRTSAPLFQNVTRKSRSAAITELANAVEELRLERDARGRLPTGGDFLDHREEQVLVVVLQAPGT